MKKNRNFSSGVFLQNTSSDISDEIIRNKNIKKEEKQKSAKPLHRIQDRCFLKRGKDFLKKKFAITGEYLV